MPITIEPNDTTVHESDDGLVTVDGYQQINVAGPSALDHYNVWLDDEGTLHAQPCYKFILTPSGD